MFSSLTVKPLLYLCAALVVGWVGTGFVLLYVNSQLNKTKVELGAAQSLVKQWSESARSCSKATEKAKELAEQQKHAAELDAERHAAERRKLQQQVQDLLRRPRPPGKTACEHAEEVIDAELQTVGR